VKHTLRPKRKHGCQAWRGRRRGAVRLTTGTLRIEATLARNDVLTCTRCVSWPGATACAVCCACARAYVQVSSACSIHALRVACAASCIHHQYAWSVNKPRKPGCPYIERSHAVCICIFEHFLPRSARKRRTKIVPRHAGKQMCTATSAAPRPGLKMRHALCRRVANTCSVHMSRFDPRTRVANVKKKEKGAGAGVTGRRSVLGGAGVSVCAYACARHYLSRESFILRRNACICDHLCMRMYV
jgi:hypothetical protein